MNRIVVTMGRGPVGDLLQAIFTRGQQHNLDIRPDTGRERLVILKRGVNKHHLVTRSGRCWHGNVAGMAGVVLEGRSIYRITVCRGNAVIFPGIGVGLRLTGITRRHGFSITAGNNRFSPGIMGRRCFLDGRRHCPVK